MNIANKSNYTINEQTVLSIYLPNNHVSLFYVLANFRGLSQEMALIHKKISSNVLWGPFSCRCGEFSTGVEVVACMRIAHLLRRQQQLTVAAGISVVLDSVL